MTNSMEHLEEKLLSQANTNWGGSKKVEITCMDSDEIIHKL